MIRFLLRCRAFLSVCSSILFGIAAVQSAQAASSASITLGYGEDAAQHLDIYLPENPVAAPTLVLVQGDAWKSGDQSSRAVLVNKLDYWLPKGFIIVAMSYRLLPAATPMEQAQDVAKALGYLQVRIKKWGGDPDKLVVMGHSSGGHLVALLSAAPAAFQAQALKPWRASVILDSSALDVPVIMNNKHARMYDQAFGENQSFWAATSPLHQLKRNGIPMLLVCSTKRDDACPQADMFNAEAEKVGIPTQVQREELSHRDINNELGDDEVYTTAVDAYLRAKLNLKL